MDSQLPRTQGHHFEATDLSGKSAELNSGVEGHSEKPSMMKRVKAKAKKMKNTLTSHSPDHDHDHSPSQEEDEDEEMVEDPETHGAPIHEAAADKGAARASGGQSATGGTNSDSPSMVDPRYDSPMFDQETGPFVQRQEDEDRRKLLLKEDKHAPAPGRDVYKDFLDQVGGPNAMEGNRGGKGTTNSQGPDIRAHPSNDQVNDDHKKLLKEDKHSPVPGRDVNKERENLLSDQVGGPNAMEGNRGGKGATNYQADSQGPDIRAHSSNDQIKTIDPADGRGREEAEGITPVIKSFNKMGISEKKPKPEQGNAAGLNTGSHNQFDPEPVTSESSDSVSKGYNAANSRDMPSSESSESFPKSYNAAANPQDMPKDVVNPASKSSTYTEKMTSASAAASSAIAGAKNVLASKIGQKREPGKDSKPGEGNKSGSAGSESSESFPKSYNAAANPQDMPEDVVKPASQSSTYTEKMTSASAAASSAIAGTAQSAKNVIASRIGQTREPGKDSNPGEGNKSGSVMGTAGDYANKVAATVTSTLAPVYGKVVGSGATSKESGLGSDTAQESSGGVGQDKGVSRKPGEKDTESFSKPNGEKEEVPSSGGGERNISQIVSDAVHEREPEEKRPMGKVTESKEVAKRLGTGEEGSGLENVGSGGGMVSKLTGAIGSWLGGQGGRAQSTPGTTLADDNAGDMGKNADAQQGVTGERRPQE